MADIEPAPASAARARRRRRRHFALSPGVLQGCVFETCILLVAVLLMSLASREFASPDWDLEWLVTLPVSLSTLLGVRILERILVNPTGLLTLWPFLSAVAWESGHRPAHRCWDWPWPCSSSSSPRQLDGRRDLAAVG